MIILILLCLWITFLIYSISKRYLEYNKIKNIFLNVVSCIKGLGVNTTGILRKPWIRGKIDHNVILVGLIPGLSHYIEICITRQNDFPYHLYIADRLMDSEKPSLIRTSNEDFNKRIFISSLYTTGSTAYMDRYTRELIHTLFSFPTLFTLEGNRITLQFHYSMKDIVAIEKNTKKALECMLQLIKRLTRQGNIIDLLTENALSDPDRIIRRRNLELLISHFSFEDLKATLKKALQDSDREIKFIAADRLGKEGLPHLYNLFNNVHPWDKEFRIKIVSSIVRIRGKESMNFLINFYNTLQRKDHRMEIINLLENYGDEQASNMLIEELKEVIDIELKIAIIDALSKCGTLDTVEPLYEISKQIIILPSLKMAAKKAIARIQSRYDSGDEGWLSLIDTDQSEGSLSIVDTETDETS